MTGLIDTGTQFFVNYASPLEDSRTSFSCGCGRKKENHSEHAIEKGEANPGPWNTLQDCRDVPTDGYGKINFTKEDTDQTPDVSVHFIR